MSLNVVEPELNEENESTMSLNKIEPELNEENESNKECGNIFDRMPLDILEKSLLLCTSLVRQYSSWQCLLHLPKFCCCHPTFQSLERKTMGFLSRLYVNDHTVFPKDKRVPGEVHVNIKRLSQFFGVHRRVIMKVRLIVNNPRWYCAWLVLLAEACDWYIVTNIHWKKRK